MPQAEALERPLPRPRKDPAGYAAARTLEALLESILALEFLERGYTRNAAGKAFQAWRALTAAILALEASRIAEKLDPQQREWLHRHAVPRVPTARLKPLSNLIEEAGYPSYSAYTDKVLNLHDYQYHGPDPDPELSKYRSREEAAHDTLYILKRLVEIVEEKLRPRLQRRGQWGPEHQEALSRLKQALRCKGDKSPEPESKQ